MQSINWRTPSAYRHVKDLPAAGFAWEYLRRNEDYRKDVERFNRTGAFTAEELDTFASRWGLRFRTRPRRAA
ncbi:transcriptional regulator domain-containing protein [Paracoccus sp. P2]|uniref:transcriptional regulator domain-containing protein n=1 Tax=Alphaproteobacteria TaxID=28211 RepID=UPI001FEC1A8B|nr:DUF6499 domain-containing protein [Chelatococcus caeni]